MVSFQCKTIELESETTVEDSQVGQIIRFEDVGATLVVLRSRDKQRIELGLFDTPTLAYLDLGEAEKGDSSLLGRTETEGRLDNAVVGGAGLFVVVPVQVVVDDLGPVKGPQALLRIVVELLGHEYMVK